MTPAELIDLLGSLASQPSEPTASSKPWRHSEPTEQLDGLSALDHALQCAFELATVRPDDIGLQLAGLVHDLGHRFGPDSAHGRLGADVVRPLLGDRVAALVAAHVPAKRFLVATDPSYGAQLSADSVRTLALQGGPFGPGEAHTFASSPVGADAVVLRRADDAAKIPGRAVPPLAHWVPVMLEWTA